MTESTAPRTDALRRQFVRWVGATDRFHDEEQEKFWKGVEALEADFIAARQSLSEGVDAQDAARYRWLRTRYVGLHFEYGREEDEDGKRAGYPAIVIKIPEKSAWSLPWPGVPVSKFDAAVDAAMKLEPLK